MKPIILSKHARDRMAGRGAEEHEVRSAFKNGARKVTRDGKIWCRQNFTFKSTWQGRYYAVKQVAPIIVEEPDKIVVVTVYAFYF